MNVTKCFIDNRCHECHWCHEAYKIDIHHLYFIAIEVRAVFQRLKLKFKSLGDLSKSTKGDFGEYVK